MKSSKALAFLTLIFGSAISASPTVANSRKASAPQAAEEAGSLPSGAALFAELDSALDSKKAKTGDPVTARTTRDVKYNGKVILSRNTKLLGHVTQASARSKGDPDSTLAIQFDKAVPKKGPEVLLKLMVRAIAAPERYTPSSGSDQNMVNLGTQTSPMGSPRSTMPGSAPNSTANGSASPPDNDAGKGRPDSFSEASRGVIGIDGLQLTPPESANEEKGAWFASSGKSVHLEGGTRLLFSVQ